MAINKGLLFGIILVSVILVGVFVSAAQDNGDPFRALSSAIDQLKVNVTTLFGTTSTLQTNVNSLNNGISGLNGKVDGLQSSVNVLGNTTSGILQLLAAIQAGSNSGNGNAPPSSAGIFVDIEQSGGGMLQGESTDRNHENWIDAISYSYGLANAGSSSTGSGSGAGKATFHDLQFTKRLDTSSPKLYLDTASGEHIPKVVIEVIRKSGSENPTKMLTITLTNVLITSVSVSSSNTETNPTETVTLNFEKIQWEYTPINADGSPGTAVQSGWDLVQNQLV